MKICLIGGFLLLYFFVGGTALVDGYDEISHRGDAFHDKNAFQSIPNGNPYDQFPSKGHSPYRGSNDSAW